MLQKLVSAAYKTVGLKQTMKAIKAGNAEVVFLAGDVDNHIAVKIKDQCSKSNVRLEMVDSMKELGNACGIRIGAATAAILKQL